MTTRARAFKYATELDPPRMSARTRAALAKTLGKLKYAQKARSAKQDAKVAVAS